MRASICKAHNYLPHNLERQVLLPFVYNSPLLPAFAKAALDLGYLMPEHVFNHYSTQDAGGWGNGGGGLLEVRARQRLWSLYSTSALRHPIPRPQLPRGEP